MIDFRRLYLKYMFLMVSSLHSQQESEMQYLGAVSKRTEWSQFLSKANHLVTQQCKSMPQLLAEEAEVEWFYEDLQAF